MAQQFDSLSDRLIEFIHQQHMFFCCNSNGRQPGKCFPQGHGLAKSVKQ